jgi:dTDP-4-amino-4,6-dideoxygalactose transaminase
MNSGKQINVTKTYLPPLDDYIKYLKKIWMNGWITNHGPLVNSLENKLKKYLGVRHLFFVANGTVALEISMKALNLTKEIITTPFSYVATTSSIVWVNCIPVFVDIEPESLCINPMLIQNAITDKTQAILATHVYGNPCDVEALDKIAKKNKLKIIYDASHCFEVKYKGTSILNYGDISTLSFHATKLFHTAEGGAVITNNDKLAHRISYLRNFGHHGQEAFWGLGINGKNSELHAAMGLCILPKVKSFIKQRKEIYKTYSEQLKDSGLKFIKIREGTDYNYSYFPILFKNQGELLKVRKVLNKNNIFPRRYFYPSLLELDYVKKFNSSVSSNISKRILCLPLYYGLNIENVKKISEIIKEAIKCPA